MLDHSPHSRNVSQSCAQNLRNCDNFARRAGGTVAAVRIGTTLFAAEGGGLEAPKGQAQAEHSSAMSVAGRRAPHRHDNSLV